MMIIHEKICIFCCWLSYLDFLLVIFVEYVFKTAGGYRIKTSNKKLFFYVIKFSYVILVSQIFFNCMKMKSFSKLKFY